MVVPQSDALADLLHAQLLVFAADPTRLQAMGQAARRLAKPDAAEHVADAVLEVVK